jgi:8-oxo-dGTP pyrophosphatase MutT (NUDIX family)
VVGELDGAMQAEIRDLARRFGEPRALETVIDDRFRDPIWKRDRHGEVCMVIRRPAGTLLLSIKTFYPRGAFRLPTGGIHHGEGILASLRREAHEETGLETVVRRFLARIAYRPLSAPQGLPVFHTFAFLLDEVGGTLGTLDRSERIEEWHEIEPGELPLVADRLDRIDTQGTEDIGGDWAAWGRFRAIVHRTVHEALTVPPGAQTETLRRMPKR